MHEGWGQCLHVGQLTILEETGEHKALVHREGQEPAARAGVKVRVRVGVRVRVRVSVKVKLGSGSWLGLELRSG